jgi:hypothetical protein
MATNYCPQCGAEVSNNDRFCPRCGAGLEEEKNKTTVITRGSQSRSTLPLPLLVLILVGAALIVAGLFLNGDKEGGESAAVATAAPPASEVPFPNASRISLEEAKALYDAGDAIFVDVRDADAYGEAHIARAISVPLDGDTLDPAYQALAKGSRIITYCT